MVEQLTKSRTIIVLVSLHCELVGGGYMPPHTIRIAYLVMLIPCFMYH